MVFWGSISHFWRLPCKSILLLVPLEPVFRLAILNVSINARWALLFGLLYYSSDVVAIFLKRQRVVWIQLSLDRIASLAKRSHVHLWERSCLVWEVAGLWRGYLQVMQGVRQISVSWLPAHKGGWILNLTQKFFSQMLVYLGLLNCRCIIASSSLIVQFLFEFVVDLSL